ncbi:hypothetical protein ACFL53_05390, partial [Pseudomonadota bacterium]
MITLNSAEQIAVSTPPVSETMKHLVVTPANVFEAMERYGYDEPTMAIIQRENLLPAGLLSRLHASYPQHSGFLETRPMLFVDKEHYTGLSGFREVISILHQNGIDIGDIEERELFVEVYRFLATRHTLNSINWDNYTTDSVFQLVFPQPGMIDKQTTQTYLQAESREKRTQVALDYMEKTNPHDGNQQLNKPWFENDQ